ncbi:MAG: HAD-IA family hydrolase [Candidatus ainarchaeum sp.]|nr:HAD-IA family hydrolase [Candidatus ainarchaeum sp.]
MPKLVIFDFDDTLLHLNVRWDAVRNDVIALARKEGVAVDPKQHLVPMGNLLSNAPARKKAIDAIYLRHEADCIAKANYVVFPQMLALAKDLKANGFRLGMASGNHTDNIRRILAELNEAGLFEFVCGRDMVAHNKPAPDQLLVILGKAGLGAKDAIFVGDSINDAGAAKAAGMAHFHVRPNDEGDIRKLRGLLLPSRKE